VRTFPFFIQQFTGWGEMAFNKQLMKFSFYSHDLRKSVAKVLTVINANQRSQLRLFYKNKKYLPLDLRPKQTRAIRRRLSKSESGKVLEKTKKRAVHFPQRKYAIKVGINSASFEGRRRELGTDNYTGRGLEYWVRNDLISGHESFANGLIFKGRCIMENSMDGMESPQ
jgi:hypothetical protein